MKKFIKKIIALSIVLAMIFTFVACIKDDDSPDDGKKPTALTPLEDITDYGASEKYYVVAKAIYDASERTRNVALIDTKIGEKNSADADKKVTITVDDSTVRKIFYNSTGEGIMQALEKAALPQDKMIALVDYLTKDEGGAIEDYDKLDELQKKYDENDTNANDKLLQMHRYRMAAKIIAIFKEDGDQFARVGYEALLYAQVVAEEMFTAYKNTTPTPEKPSVVDGSTYKHSLVGDDLAKYFKYGIKDYDAYAYIAAFNETDTSSGKKEIVRLYGYYYHYEKKNQDVLPIDKFERRLDLSYMTSYETDALALEYRDLNRIHYAGAYRYTSDFYTKYNKAHFAFQGKIEIFEQTYYATEGYGFETPLYEKGIGPNGASYSDIMKDAITRDIASVLKISDVDYEYTGVDENVTVYRIKQRLWDTCNQNVVTSEIIEVNLETEQLKSQSYTLGHKTISTTGANNDMSNALDYQIRTYQSDYLRGIQSSKKSLILLYDDLYYYTNIYNGADKATKIADTIYEIGRESVIEGQIEEDLSEANITAQIDTAKGYGSQGTWAKIKTEMDETIAYDYQSIANANPMKDEVSNAFQDMLVRRKHSCDVPVIPGAKTHNCKDSGGATACSTKDKTYDRAYSISALAYNHEAVLYYSSNQVQLSFYEFNMNSIDMKNKLDTNAGIGTTVKMGLCLNTNLTSFSFNATAIAKIYITAGEDIPAGKLHTTSAINKFTVGESKNGYTLSFTAEKDGAEFVWYLDKDLKYPIRFKDDDAKGTKKDQFSFNMKLYPGYLVTKNAFDTTIKA